MTKTNVDISEINKFSHVAAHWWDKQGELKSLHDINPLRLSWIMKCTNLSNKFVVDVGCGGGILSESMAAQTAIVTGIDMSKAAIRVANLHKHESQLEIEYLHTTAEDLASERPQKFDVVTCMELLEHVPDPVSVIKSCAELVRPDGDVFFSTLNRNLKSYLFAIVGAEYFLKLLPHHTHSYEKFIKPSELDTWARAAGLRLKNMTGLTYNPLNKEYKLCDDVGVNYMVHYRKG